MACGGGAGLIGCGPLMARAACCSGPGMGCGGPITKEQELQVLRQQAEYLKENLRAVRRRIQELGQDVKKA